MKKTILLIISALALIGTWSCSTKEGNQQSSPDTLQLIRNATIKIHYVCRADYTC